MFVSSTIPLEGVIRWFKASGHFGDRLPHIGCFDWDPLVSALTENIVMLRQDVPSMLDELFKLIDAETGEPRVIEVPTLFVPLDIG